MKSNILKFVICAGALLAVAQPRLGMAQTVDGSMFVNPTVNLSSGTQNGHVGQAGGVFLSTYNYWPYVNWLGYYDKDGDGLASSHQVALWRVGGAGGNGSQPDALVTIPAGTAAPLYNGYRWVQLPATGSGPGGSLGLWYGTWYTLSAETDGVDTWGDLISGGQVGWSAQYVDVAGNEWSRAGRYDVPGTWPASPGSQVSTTDSIYPVVNMGYNLPIVPEPTGLTIMGLGLALLYGARRKTSH